MSTAEDLKKADDYFSKQADQIEADQRQRLKDAGYEQSYRLEIGETKLTVLKLIPADRNTKFGGVKVFQVIVDGDQRELMVGNNSPLRREIVNRLAEVNADRVDLTIVRTGTGQQTRYSVK